MEQQIKVDMRSKGSFTINLVLRTGNMKTFIKGYCPPQSTAAERAQHYYQLSLGFNSYHNTTIFSLGSK